MPDKITVYHIPVCPFSQRLEILLALKGETGAVRFVTVDITRPRDPELLRKTRGTTALPVLETPDGQILKESLVILRYLDELLGAPVRQADPMRHAVENMLIAREGPFTAAGYILVMNQDPGARDALTGKLRDLYRDIDDFLMQHAPEGPFLFEDFGLAETVFTPMFMRFWFLEHYEGFGLPQTDDFARVEQWRAACLAHPKAQQVSREEIVKLYYDYARGAGNGALPEGRTVSSFAFTPRWRDRPMPPQDKYGPGASDAKLGLLPA
ncbi:glutathione S-transferase family protein [Aestuariicoccus sp. MJ-SS9]|uniref:glutathione S-transferase family protein n=1 Tax=Aestuariicoccus sp. MJ-SS9 TaxID=3079855 RepID=UPI002906C010|nr:glutathione S-transferase family protein [Aestuariicoccus sp. MJ-SS9]MDU8913219.1 glutathione S-transferase family protein [Aestuariicoccus sp. MJ-SS9]